MVAAGGAVSIAVVIALIGAMRGGVVGSELAFALRLLALRDDCRVDCQGWMV